MIYHGDFAKGDNMGKLDGKVAIVTGATSGMGRESAKLFAAEGAKVVVTGRNEERAKEVVDDIKAAGNEATYVIADMANLMMFKKYLTQPWKLTEPSMSCLTMQECFQCLL